MMDASFEIDLWAANVTGTAYFHTFDAHLLDYWRHALYS